MTQRTHIDDLKSRIASADLQTQVAALEEAAEMIESIVEAATQGLRNTSNALVTTERIAMLGVAVVPAFEHFVANSESSEKRTLASILLLSLGSSKGLADVFEAVKCGGDNQFLAASRLADAGVKQAGDLIINRLRSLASTELLKREQAPKFASLLSSLKKLEIGLPADLKEQFKRSDVPEEISGMIN